MICDDDACADVPRELRLPDLEVVLDGREAIQVNFFLAHVEAELRAGCHVDAKDFDDVEVGTDVNRKDDALLLDG